MKKSQFEWTKYLTERALLRAWHAFGARNLCREIATSDKNLFDNGRSLFAKCYRALYDGIYNPKNSLKTENTLKTIKQIRKLPKSATLANFMSPKEIVTFINAMFECENKIKHYKTVLDAETLTKICFEIGKKYNFISKKINDLKVNSDLQSLSPVQPNCSSLLKRIRTDLKSAFFTPTTIIYSENSTEKQHAKFDKTLSKYRMAYSSLQRRLKQIPLTDKDKTNQLVEKTLKVVDREFYATKLQDFGFDFHDLTTKENVEELISRRELLEHTEKIELITKKLDNYVISSPKNYESTIKKIGKEIREKYISKYNTYPVGKGFYNALATTIAESFKKGETIFDEIGKDTERLYWTITKKLKEMAYKSKAKEDKNLTRSKLIEIDGILESQ